MIKCQIVLNCFFPKCGLFQPVLLFFSLLSCVERLFVRIAEFDHSLRFLSQYPRSMSKKRPLVPNSPSIFHMFRLESTWNCSTVARNVTRALCIQGFVYAKYCGRMFAMWAELDKNPAFDCIQNKQMHNRQDFVLQEPEQNICSSPQNGKRYSLLSR